MTRKPRSGGALWRRDGAQNEDQAAELNRPRDAALKERAA